MRRHLKKQSFFPSCSWLQKSLCNIFLLGPLHIGLCSWAFLCRLSLSVCAFHCTSYLLYLHSLWKCRSQTTFSQESSVGLALKWKVVIWAPAPAKLRFAAPGCNISCCYGWSFYLQMVWFCFCFCFTGVQRDEKETQKYGDLCPLENL